MRQFKYIFIATKLNHSYTWLKTKYLSGYFVGKLMIDNNIGEMVSNAGNKIFSII